jgi:hypothetical protein
MTDNNAENSQLNGKIGDSVAEPIVLPADPGDTEPIEQVEPIMADHDATKTTDSASLSRLTPGAVLFGIVVSVGLATFVLLARLTVHPFDKIDRKMKVIDVWRRLRNDLPDVAHPTILGIIFDVSMALIVIGTFACIWLALMATNDQPETLTESENVDRPLTTDFSAFDTGR